LMMEPTLLVSEGEFHHGTRAESRPIYFLWSPPSGILVDKVLVPEWRVVCLGCEISRSATLNDCLFHSSRSYSPMSSHGDENEGKHEGKKKMSGGLFYVADVGGSIVWLVWTQSKTDQVPNGVMIGQATSNREWLCILCNPAGPPQDTVDKASR
jgi:hypothetical protein